MRRACLLVVIVLGLAGFLSFTIIGPTKAREYYYVGILRAGMHTALKFRTFDQLERCGEEAVLPPDALKSLGLSEYCVHRCRRVAGSFLVAELYNRKENNLAHILIERGKDGSLRIVARLVKFLG